MVVELEEQEAEDVLEDFDGEDCESGSSEVRGRRDGIELLQGSLSVHLKGERIQEQEISICSSRSRSILLGKLTLKGFPE